MKNPYLAVRAAKLDSATDISELKLSNASVDGLTSGIHPNEGKAYYFALHFPGFLC